MPRALNTLLGGQAVSSRTIDTARGDKQHDESTQATRRLGERKQPPHEKVSLRVNGGDRWWRD